MKYSPVVPQIVFRGLKFYFRDVGSDPVHELGCLAQPFPVRINGSLGDIEDRDVLISTGKKVINQRGLTSTDIND